MKGRIMRIVVIFIVILYPEWLQAGMLADYPKLDTLQINQDSLDCCPGQYKYDLLYGLRGEDGKIVGWNDPVVGYIENDPPTSLAHYLGRGLSLGALPELKMIGGIWKVVSSGKDATKGVQFIVNPSKFDYFFGRVVAGNAHNVMRSAQNLKDLKILGIETEEQLMKVFAKAFVSGAELGVRSNNYGTTVIKSINIGSKGKIEVSFFYSGNNFSSVPKVTTIIPKIF